MTITGKSRQIAYVAAISIAMTAWMVFLFEIADYLIAW